jgi:nitroreductase
MLKDLIAGCRSYRRFDQSARIPLSQLESWVDSARLVASSANRQPLKYALVTDEAVCARIFDACAWAAALPDWSGPQQGERPSAYIVILADQRLSMNEVFTARDEGIAAQTIMLQAREAGFGGCMISGIRRKECAAALGVDGAVLVPEVVLALGKPVEQVCVESLPADDSTAYWRDEQQVHHVPKRAIDDVVIIRI